MEHPTCCSPNMERPEHTIPTPAPAVGTHAIDQAHIPGGRFMMGDHQGDGHPADGESPTHPVALEGFSIDTTTVTNADFRVFADATGYVTEAELYGFSAVFDQVVAAPQSHILNRVAGSPWWIGVRHADWMHPGGSLSSIEGLDDHPVVHVSWNDAQHYCDWAGRRLPTEAEWEYASRGGVEAARYPWGEEGVDEGGWRANIWQGQFPLHNTLADGWLATSPVGTFAPNGWGLFDSVGNVWEWCADWFDAGYYRHSAEHSPKGPETGHDRVVRGGSFLCHDSYCNRYRNAARTSNSPDSSASNLGFRTVGLTHS